MKKLALVLLAAVGIATVSLAKEPVAAANPIQCGLPPLCYGTPICLCDSYGRNCQWFCASTYR